MAKDLGSKEKKRKRTLRAFARECPHQRKLLYTVCVVYCLCCILFVLHTVCVVYCLCCILFVLYTVCVAVTQVDGYFGKCNFLLAFKLSEFRETDTER